MTDLRAKLGERLYVSFWGRNHPSGVGLADFEKQADAIRNMWFGIAQDAIDLIKLPDLLTRLDAAEGRVTVLDELVAEFEMRADAASSVGPYLPEGQAIASRSSAGSYRECARLLKLALASPSTAGTGDPTLLDQAARVEAGLIEAFKAGFAVSGEGWNGEYPLGQRVDDWLLDQATNYVSDLSSPASTSPRVGGGDE